MAGLSLLKYVVAVCNLAILSNIEVAFGQNAEPAIPSYSKEAYGRTSGTCFPIVAIGDLPIRFLPNMQIYNNKPVYEEIQQDEGDFITDVSRLFIFHKGEDVDGGWCMGTLTDPTGIYPMPSPIFSTLGCSGTKQGDCPPDDVNYMRPGQEGSVATSFQGFPGGVSVCRPDRGVNLNAAKPSDRFFGFGAEFVRCAQNSISYNSRISGMYGCEAHTEDNLSPGRDVVTCMLEARSMIGAFEGAVFSGYAHNFRECSKLTAQQHPGAIGASFNIQTGECSYVTSFTHFNTAHLAYRSAFVTPRLGDLIDARVYTHSTFPPDFTPTTPNTAAPDTSTTTLSA